MSKILVKRNSKVGWIDKENIPSDEKIFVKGNNSVSLVQSNAISNGTFITKEGSNVGWMEHLFSKPVLSLQTSGEAFQFITDIEFDESVTLQNRTGWIDWPDGTNTQITNEDAVCVKSIGSQVGIINIWGNMTHIIIRGDMFGMGSQDFKGSILGGDTSRLTDMSIMFSECNLTGSIPNFDTRNVKNMCGMFSNCSNLIGSIPNFDTSKVTDTSSMFYRCRNLIGSIPNFNTGNVTSMGEMFHNCSNLTGSIPNFDTRNVTTMGAIFNQCSNLTSFTPGWLNMNYPNGTSKANSVFQNMFNNCVNLTGNAQSLFGTSRNIYQNAGSNLYTFTNCKKLDDYMMIYDTWGGGKKEFSLDIPVLSLQTSGTAFSAGISVKFDSGSGEGQIDWPDGTNTQILANGVFNKSIDASVGIINIFGNMTGLSVGTAFSGSILGGDTSKLTDMSGMFGSCSNLTGSIPNFNTSNVTRMDSMFYYCSKLTGSIPNFDTSKVTSMYMTFNYCYNLTGSIPNFNTSNMTTMYKMFYYCNNLTGSIPNFNTSNVTSMCNMFSYCSNLTGSIPNFNTSNVTNTNSMFWDCINLTGSIPNFNTSNVTDMGFMFHNCRKLTGSIPNFNITKVTNMNNMFRNCNNLTGYNLFTGTWAQGKGTA